jgi:hypothetical protein
MVTGTVETKNLGDELVVGCVAAHAVELGVETYLRARDSGACHDEVMDWAMLGMVLSAVGGVEHWWRRLPW